MASNSNRGCLDWILGKKPSQLNVLKHWNWLPGERLNRHP